jgi:hypothetical protein
MIWHCEEDGDVVRYDWVRTYAYATQRDELPWRVSGALGDNLHPDIIGAVALHCHCACGEGGWDDGEQCEEDGDPGG